MNRTAKTVGLLGASLFLGCGISLPKLDGKGDDAGAQFAVTGALTSTSVASLTAAGSRALAVNKTITHVMAVNPTSANAERVLATVGADGKFSLNIDGSRPWILVFIDSTKVGKEMVVSTLKSNALDSLAPRNAEGEANLGNVSVQGQTATPGISYEQLLSQLGLSESDADYLGRVDDLCLRYVNPDIDGDGVIDAEQDNHQFMLDFHVQLAVQVSDVPVTVADLVGQYLSDSATLRYGGTGVYVAYPAAFESADPSTTGSVSFEEPVYYYPGGSSPSAAFVEGGVEIQGADLMNNNFSDSRSFGLYAEGGAGHDLPQGEYVFKVGSKTLTFTHVATRSDAELDASIDFIMPFIKFNPVNPSCTSACTVASVDYKWMKRTVSGWVPATLGEVNLTVGDMGGFLSLRAETDTSDKNIGMFIPNTAISGTLPWSSSGGTLLMNLTEAQMQALRTDQLCHLGLSYDDKLGMRYFSGIGNALGTCL